MSLTNASATAISAQQSQPASYCDAENTSAAQIAEESKVPLDGDIEPTQTDSENETYYDTPQEPADEDIRILGTNLKPTCFQLNEMADNNENVFLINSKSKL